MRTAATDYELIISALKAHATTLARESRSRPYSGEHNKTRRAALRAQAQDAASLAEEMRYAGTIPAGQHTSQPAYQYMISALRQVKSS